MLKAAFARPQLWRSRLSVAVKLLGGLCAAILACRAALGGASAKLVPLLAQDTSSEGGYPIIEWAIVVVFIGGALFVICRSSRRN